MRPDERGPVTSVIPGNARKDRNSCEDSKHEEGKNGDFQVPPWNNRLGLVWGTRVQHSEDRCVNRNNRCKEPSLSIYGALYTVQAICITLSGINLQGKGNTSSGV